MNVLGLHGGVTLGQHEPGAAIIIDGRIVASCEEERYLRIKSAYGHLPYHSIKACLEIARLSFDDIDLVVAPGVTYGDFAARLSDFLRHSFGVSPKIELIHHQKAHLHAAFYGSGLDEALCLSLDATGDGLCGMLAHATREDGIRVLEELPTENSLGYFYTLMTYYLGFADGDEYKVMGLAPFGEASIDLDRIVQPTDCGWRFDWSFVRSDPPIRSPFEPLYAQQVADVIGSPNRIPGAEISTFFRDVAASTQAQFEACLLSLVRYLRTLSSDTKHLCYAGGNALNCVANKRVLEEAGFENIYVSPVSSDRGLALGCAYAGAVSLGDKVWPIWNTYLGSSYSNDAIRAELTGNAVPFAEVEDPGEAAAALLAEGKIIGWYQGRSEAGARALGARSILAACGDDSVKDKVNARIKYREGFRPFAPSILDDEASSYFHTNDIAYPYMNFTVDAVAARADSIRAVVHVDNTARVQTVRSSDNELYYDMIRQFRQKTGAPVILNTSFNLKGQPIVETPRDALMTFFGCGLDALIMGDFLVEKHYGR